MNPVLHAEVQLPDFGTIGLVESRYRPRELGHRSREYFAVASVFSPQKRSRFPVGSAVTIIMPYRESTPSRGVTRGVAVGLQTPVSGATREKKEEEYAPSPSDPSSTSFDPRSHPLSPRGRVDIRPASNVAVSDLHKVVNESPRYL